MYLQQVLGFDSQYLIDLIDFTSPKRIFSVYGNMLVMMVISSEFFLVKLFVILIMPPTISVGLLSLIMLARSV